MVFHQAIQIEPWFPSERRRQWVNRALERSAEQIVSPVAQTDHVLKIRNDTRGVVNLRIKKDAIEHVAYLGAGGGRSLS